MGPEFLVSETADPFLFTALAVASGLWLFNKLLSTNPKMVAEGKPYGVLDSDGLLWAATNVKNLKTTPLPGVNTVYDLVQHGIKTNGPRDALGKRPLLERHYEDLNGKKVEKLTYADHYEWMSYTQFGKAISSLGAGLVGLANLKPQDRVIIYAETQREWMLREGEERVEKRKDRNAIGAFGLKMWTPFARGLREPSRVAPPPRSRDEAHEAMVVREDTRVECLRPPRRRRRQTAEEAAPRPAHERRCPRDAPGILRHRSPQSKSPLRQVGPVKAEREGRRHGRPIASLQEDSEEPEPRRS